MAEVKKLSDRSFIIMWACKDVLRLICEYVTQWHKLGRKGMF